MRTKRAVLVAGGAMAISLIATANVGAATVTLGSPLTTTFMSIQANAVGTSAIVSGPGVVSPVDGTVISWQAQDLSGGPFRLRVLKLTPPDSASGDGTGPPLTANGGHTEQAVSLPIHQGEVVGFDNGAPSDHIGAVPTSSTYSVQAWTPPLTDGGTPQSSLLHGGGEFAYNATVRYCLVPAVRGKKLGAARRALADAACTLGSVKQKKTKKRGKKRKGPKVVTSQSVAPGTPLGDQASVDVLVKVKPKKKKRK